MKKISGACRVVAAMVFLKNYTSAVPVSQTIFKIEQVLIKCGVSGITKEYAPQGEVAAIRFHIATATGERTVRLPADKERALDALWLNYSDGEKLMPDGKSFLDSRKLKKKIDFAEQAERTAWKIIQDWIEVQMSMIQMKQAETEEVFLPYLWDSRSRRTVYQQLKETNYRALLTESTDNSK